jgi:hypothetical protein
LTKGNFMRKLIPVLLALAPIGCGGVKQNPEPVDVSGHVTQGGKPVSDVTFNLQPTGTGTQAMLPVKAGSFQGKVTPGRYTYYISEGRNAAAFKAIPGKYRSGALDRQIDVAEGKDLTITLD